MSESRYAPGPLLIDVAGHELDAEDRELLAHPAVGGTILFSRNFHDPRQLRALTDAMRACRPGLLVVADYEGGRVQRFRDGLTRIPPMRSYGRLWQRQPEQAVDLARRTGWLVAAELAALGVNMPLAPVVDLDYGQSAVIGERALAAHTEPITALARALCAGLRDGGSVATAKHFPGHGFVVPDSHAELPLDEREYAALAADMAPYRSLIADGLASVMMAHIRYPAVDDLPASLSPHWIGHVLRGALGFAGSVFCDDLSMAGAAAMGDAQERAGLALAAGCDWLPVCNDRAAVCTLVEAAALREDGGDRRREDLLTRCHPVSSAATLDALRKQTTWWQTADRLRALTRDSA